MKHSLFIVVLLLLICAFVSCVMEARADAKVTQEFECPVTVGRLYWLQTSGEFATAVAPPSGAKVFVKLHSGTYEVDCKWLHTNYTGVGQ